MGVALCDDGAGMLGACQVGEQCACGVGGPGPCTKCILDAMPGSASNTQDPCQPQIGSVPTQGLCETAPCTVFVLSTRGGWQAFVGATSQAFGTTATGVGSSFAL